LTIYSYLYFKYFNWAAVPGGRFSNPPITPSLFRQQQGLNQSTFIKFMKHFKHFLSFLLMIFIASCLDKPCKNSNGECRDAYETLFRIISKIDGKDLVYGPTRIYDKSKIKVFSIKGTDTTFANYEPYRLVKDGYDSILHFYYSTKVDTLFIKLNNSDIDTINVSNGISEGRCCTFNSIRFLNYNNSGALPNYNGTVEFKK
jgi:hypothetical protein